MHIYLTVEKGVFFQFLKALKAQETFQPKFIKSFFHVAKVKKDKNLFSLQAPAFNLSPTF